MGEHFRRVSFVMSVYNGEKYLGEAIKSILDQTYTDFEFIIIDDGSTDQTDDILDAFHDDRIVHVRNPSNIGLVASLNKGLDLARGEFIARMDADDISLPERLAIEIDFLSKNPDVGVVGTNYQIIDEFGRVIGEMRLPEEHDLIRWELGFRNAIAHPTVVMRKDVVRKAGGYSPNMLHAEDRDLWQRLTRVTKLHNISDMLFLHRRHSENIGIRYQDVQRKTDTKIATRVMEEILGRTVDGNIAAKLNSKSLRLPDAIQASRLLIILYQAYLEKSSLSKIERKTLSEQVARKVFNWSIPWPVRMIRYLLWACSVDHKYYKRLWWSLNERYIQRYS